LYRINVVEPEGTLSLFRHPIGSDEDIRAVFQNATDRHFDTHSRSSSARYLWSLREYVEYQGSEQQHALIGLTFARSKLAEKGTVVTDTGTEEAESSSVPPLAETLQVFVYLKRHLAAVEYNSELMYAGGWKARLERILKKTADRLEFRSAILLESIPNEEEVLRVFNSFDVLTRVRVRLRLPNPEISLYVKKLYEDLKRGGIRDYRQDMRNPAGLSRDTGSLPHASVELAQSGYKSGDILMEGIRNGKRQRETTGVDAIRGEPDVLRNFVRGMRANAKAKETRRAIDEIINEIDRIYSPSDDSYAP
jgi:hypothetical protein